jgi:hypothetical protein
MSAPPNNSPAPQRSAAAQNLAGEAGDQKTPVQQSDIPDQDVMDSDEKPSDISRFKTRDRTSQTASSTGTYIETFTSKPFLASPITPAIAATTQLSRAASSKRIRKALLPPAIQSPSPSASDIPVPIPSTLTSAPQRSGAASVCWVKMPDLPQLCFPHRSTPRSSLAPPHTLVANLNAGAPCFWDLLACEPLSEFVYIALRPPNLNHEALKRIALVLAAMSRSCFQEACWYLEETQWDVRAAITMYTRDEMIRTSRPDARQQHTDATNFAVSCQADTFNVSSLRFTTPGGRAIDLVQDPTTFNADNANHVNALNQWRNDLTRLYTLPNAAQFPRKGNTWSSQELRFIRNIYIDRSSLGSPVDMNEITQRFNETFVGRYVPTARTPCGYRDVARVAAKANEFKKSVLRKGEKVLEDKVAALRLWTVREDEEEEYEEWLGCADADDNEDEEEGITADEDVDGDVDMNDVE